MSCKIEDVLEVIDNSKPLKKQLLKATNNQTTGNITKDIRASIQKSLINNLNKRAANIANGKELVPFPMEYLDKINSLIPPTEDNLANSLGMYTPTYKNEYGVPKIDKKGGVLNFFKLLFPTNQNKFDATGKKNPNYNKANPLVSYGDFYTLFLNNPDMLDTTSLAHLTGEDLKLHKERLTQVAKFAIKFRTGIKKAFNSGNALDRLELGNSIALALFNGKEEEQWVDNPKNPSRPFAKGILTNLSLDPKIANALATVAFNFLATRGTETLFNDDEAINKILMRDKDHLVLNEEQELLTYIGLPLTSLKESLGGEAAKLLGLKLKEKDIDPAIQSRMELGLGTLITNVLRTPNVFYKNPLITQRTVNTRQLQAFNPEVQQEVAGDTTTPFVVIDHIVMDDQLVDDPSEYIEDNILANFKDVEDPLNNNTTQKVLQSVLAIANEETLPSQEAPSIDNRIANSPMKKPPQVQKNMQDMAEVSWGFNEELLDIINNSGIDPLAFLQDISKYDDDVGLLHKRELINREGKNRGYLRVIQNTWKFYNIWKNVWQSSKFFFDFSMPINNRLMLIGNIFQPQNDKFQRFFLTNSNWDIDILPGTNDLVAKAAINQSLDYGFDKNRVEKIHEDFAVVKEKYEEAAKAALRLQRNTSTDKAADAKLLIEAVNAAKESSHSFWGLLTLGKYLEAEESNTTFIMNLPIETDAATSGVIISLRQLPLGDIAIVLDKLNAGGNFSNQYTSIGDFKEDGNHDNYEQVGVGASQNVTTVINTEDPAMNRRGGENIDLSRDTKRKVIAILDSVIEPMAIEEADGFKVPKAIRNLVLKPILMVINYGANVRTVIKNYVYDRETDFYKKAIKLRNQIDTGSYLNGDMSIGEIEKAKVAIKTQLQELTNKFNALLYGRRDVIPDDYLTNTENLKSQMGEDYVDLASMTLEEIKEFELYGRRLDAFTFNVTQTYGRAIKLTIEQQFGRFAEARNIYNLALQAMYRVFSAKYNTWRKSLNREPTKEEKEQWILDNIEDAPVILSPQAKKVREDYPNTPLKELLSYGISAFKFNKIREYTADFKEQVPSTIALPSEHHTLNKDGEVEVEDREVYSSKGYASIVNLGDPGIGGFVITIHTLDSANIQYKLLDGVEESFLVHDAKMLPANDRSSVLTQTYNEGHWEINNDYSMFEELLERFRTVVTEDRLEEFDSLGKFLRDNRTKIVYNKTGYPRRSVGTTDSPKQILGTLTKVMNNIAQEVKLKREQVKDSIHTVAHAASPGSSYSVPNATVPVTAENAPSLVTEAISDAPVEGSIEVGSIVSYRRTKTKDIVKGTVLSINGDKAKIRLEGTNKVVNVLLVNLTLEEAPIKELPEEPAIPESIDPEEGENVLTDTNQNDQAFQRSTVTGKSTVEEIEQTIKPITDKMGSQVSVKVVASLDEVATDLGLDTDIFTDEQRKTAKGVYLKGTAYLIADNLGTNEAIDTLTHEAIGHLGIEGLLGKEEFKALLGKINRLKESGDKGILKVIEGLKKDYTDDKGFYTLNSVQEAREVIAHLAKNKNIPVWLDKFITRIRLALAKMGFGSVGEATILNLLANAREYVMSEQTGKPVVINNTPVFSLVESKLAETDKLVEQFKKECK